MSSVPTSPLSLTLPQEIKDIIIQHLSAYPSTLASCALAHRSLTSTSQTLLFRAVLLSGADRTNAFRESITSSHYLASLVTQLVIAELDKPWVADAVPQLLAVLEALPNLTALAMRCGAPGSLEWAVGPDAGEAPADTSVLLAQCANRLRVLELDLYFDFWSTYIRYYSFPALHTLIFSHEVWYESTIQGWLIVTPTIRRVVLWVMNGPKALRGLQVTEQGLVHGKPYWTDGEVMGGDWWLGAETMEEGRNLERIEMVVYQEEESGDGARDDVKTDPLGVYKCKDGRKVEVVIVRIPKMENRRLNTASPDGGFGAEPPQAVQDAGHPPAPMRCHPPSEEVELAFLSKDCLNDVPDELKGLSVLSSEGNYLVVGPPDVADAYGDHSVPLQVVIARHRRKNATLSPHPCFIHRLPTEVLCAIFLMCGDQNKVFDYTRDERMDSVSVHAETSFYIRSTVAIGGVCWRWYTVTRGCPQLWTLVDVPLPQPRDVATLRLSLKYSKGLPLTLRINDLHYSPKSNVIACQKFMTLVANSSRRWEEISIILRQKSPTPDELVSPLQQLPQNAFELLKKAMLRLFEDDHEGTISSRVWQKFYTSPALHAAKWFYVPVDAPASILRRLTHVGVEVILPEEIMELLRACPLLQALQAVVVPPEDLFPGRDDGYLFPILPTPIHLPYLRALTLRGMYDWSHFFDGIKAPRIRRIELVIAGVQATPICAMLSRSSASLDMLALRWVFPGCDGEIATLLRSPQLRQLKIFRYEGYKGPEREPDRFDPSPYLPPNLVTFTKIYEVAEKAYCALGM
ncbi:uncharacterized protein SCHCODRAFT_02557649 [Schizophyllum commune H4-8]|nr:uncharacterized protein SCHCODRAFT_02557649 [Schizophyllum commune H4-8]KAI5885353.1 hypothetical protein SCHCODRAFT_02557649 [Schizophyllum commune H4-8]